MEQEKYTVIAQDWYEFDYDAEAMYMSTDRFTTHHLSIDALKAYIERVRQVMESRVDKAEPDGEPYEAEVDEADYQKLQKTENGRRIW